MIYCCCFLCNNNGVELQVLSTLDQYTNETKIKEKILRKSHKQKSNQNINNFIAIALDETNILVAVHFSMKNIYSLCDIGRAVGRSKVDVSQ